MQFDWQALTAALALVCILEGLLPFAAPARFREALIQLLQLNDHGLRAVGGLSMIIGLLMLWLV